MKDIRVPYTILIGKSEGTLQFWRLILIQIFKERESDCVDCILLALAKVKW
jgi:hypothetical protein